jgi:putative ABC transport system permease protein
LIRETMRTVRLGVNSLLLHTLRSALTTAGILFGVGSVIAMLAVGEGASQEALERFKDMGTTNILVRSKKPATTAESANAVPWQALAYGLTYLEHRALESTLRTAKHVVPVRETQRNIQRAGEFSRTVVVGTRPEYLGVVNMKIDEGRWLTDLDDRSVQNVGVLGASLARNLFPLENPVGQLVDTGDGDRFTVVGVLEYQGRAAGASGTTLDECLFIPLRTSRVRFGDEVTNRSGGSFSRERVELQEVKVQMADSTQVEDAAEVIRQMLRDSHKDAGDVEIVVPLELLRQEEASKRMFNIVLGCIAGISLLVGGIGIMNVMLATVTERTREIGIRRALGAKKSHIVYQFLVETLVLACLGGLLGVGLGLALPLVIESWFKQRTIVQVFHVVLAFSTSAAVGILAGLYPAWRAANMDPVDALRHE